jgi:hypothetical protein
MLRLYFCSVCNVSYIVLLKLKTQVFRCTWNNICKICLFDNFIWLRCHTQQMGFVTSRSAWKLAHGHHYPHPKVYFLVDGFCSILVRSSLVLGMSGVPLQSVIGQPVIDWFPIATKHEPFSQSFPQTRALLDYTVAMFTRWSDNDREERQNFLPSWEKLHFHYLAEWERKKLERRNQIQLHVSHAS